ncbi:MAG: S41 family peptidase [Candidatus Peregrinibacteria bacterium]
MRRFLRISLLVLLPAITLFLGIELGLTYEAKRVEDTVNQLEFLYKGSTSGSGTVVGDPEKEVNISLLWGVWRLLSQQYIAPDKLQTTPMLYGAVDGLVRSLADPYTAFMTPPENSAFKEGLGGKLHGIGAELTTKDGKIVVVAPIKGSPADNAGILPGDSIVKVDGKDATGEALVSVVQRIRGPKGTMVTLSIERSGADGLLEIPIKRDDLTLPSVQSEVKKTATGSVGYIALNQFGDQSVAEIEKAITSFRGQSIKGIIVDLRNNGGGYLEGSVEIASLFLKSGKVVTVQRRSGEPVQHYVNGRPMESDIPLVILINEGSASASEILAGALQDAKRATIIGKKSFGKGTVQEVFDLPGGSSLRVTVARWLTPNGRDLGKEGVHPDIVVDRTQDDVVAKRDPQLDIALWWMFDHQGAANAALQGSGSLVKQSGKEIRGE